MHVALKVYFLFSEIHPLLNNKGKDKQSAGGGKKGAGRPRK